MKKEGLMKQVKQNLLTFWEKYKHLSILSYFVVYLLWFAYVEKTVTSHFHVIHMALDDVIPFCEYFIIPYLLWFAYVAWGIAFFAFHNKSDYYKLCIFLFTGMTVFLVISTIYPNGHFLRPYYFEHHNFFTMLCEKLYATDTPTNLFPSIHVYNSLAVHIAVVKSDEFKKGKVVRLISFILCSSIILATMFLKQHSFFDVLTACGLAFVMYQVLYAKAFAKETITEKQTKNQPQGYKKGLPQI